MSNELFICLWRYGIPTVALAVSQCFTFMQLMESRLDRKKTLWTSIVFVSIALIVCIGGCWIFSLEREAPWSLFTLTLPSIFFFLWLSKYRDMRFWVTYCISDVSIAAIDYLTYVLCLCIFKDPEAFWAFPIRSVACAAAAFMVYRLVRPNYVIALRELHKGWSIMLSVVLLSYVIMSLLSSYPTPIHERPQDYLVSIVSMIFVEAMIVVIVYLIASMLNAQMKSRQESEMALRLQLTRQQMDALRDSVEQTRTMRHDLKHQMQVMQMMCKAGNYEGLQDYLQEGITKSEIVVPQYCKNYVANLLLYHYATLATRSGVVFRCQANLPEKLKLKDTTLTTLLGNALSNALEAAQTSQDGKGEMDLLLNVKQNTLVMSLRNTAPTPPQEKDGELISSKGEGHGYGFASLRHLVEEADGLCQWTYENGTFRLDVALPLPLPLS